LPASEALISSVMTCNSARAQLDLSINAPLCYWNCCCHLQRLPLSEKIMVVSWTDVVGGIGYDFFCVFVRLSVVIASICPSMEQIVSFNWVVVMLVLWFQLPLT
jgi:hypothetical protein